MSRYSSGLRRLIATLEEAKFDLNLARLQARNSEDLEYRGVRAAVQAARVVVAAVDLGFTQICPLLDWILSSQRQPDDPARTPLRGELNARGLQTTKFTCGSGCDPDGTPRDDEAMGLWQMIICPVLRSGQAVSKAAAGTFDFPPHLRDEQGRLLGADGQPLTVIKKKDPKTGRVIGGRLDGRPARVTDNLEEPERLEYLRCLVADWADAMDIAAGMLQEEFQEAEKGATSPEMQIGIVEARPSRPDDMKRESEERTESDRADQPESPTGFLGGTPLADALGIHPTQRNAFFQKLKRKRKSLGDDAWHEIQNPRPNGPYFLYRVDSPELRKLAAGYHAPKLT